MGWLRRLFSRERLEADLDKELRFHFESQVADKVRSGIPESEARRLTRIEFGGIEQIKEDCRERRGTMWLESLLQDVRYALRQLRKSPGFTLTAVLTLALGIGATTAIFTLVQQVMLQSLPVARPDQLWRIGDQPHCCDWAGYSQDSDGEPGNWSLFPWEAYKLFRANTTGFQDLAALQAGNMPLAVRAPAHRDRRIRRMASMSPETFSRLWVYPRGAEGCSSTPTTWRARLRSR
jgi:macrolide transport system ATP-binding/permease protein